MARRRYNAEEIIHKLRPDKPALTSAVVSLASQYGRYGLPPRACFACIPGLAGQRRYSVANSVGLGALRRLSSARLSCAT